MTLVNWIKAGDNYILTVEIKSWWFWRKPYRLLYIGSCTVWHTYPDFIRCGTLTEAVLADFWEHIQFVENAP